MNLDEMRTSRKSASTAYIDFLNDIKLDEHKVFCFFEGEDRKYYMKRLVKSLNLSLDSIKSYQCNGKKEVIRILEILRARNYDAIYNTLFFIDKDYDKIDIEHNKLYITDAYSIENYYVSKSTFGRILQIEFGMNTGSKDFEKCLLLYEENLYKFCLSIIDLSKILHYFVFNNYEDINGKKITINDFKISKHFHQYNFESINPKVNLDIGYFCGVFGLSLHSDICFDDSTEYLSDDIVNRTRGKFLIEFLKCSINLLKEKNANRTYFSKYYQSASINIDNNILSILSDYAETPESFINFIDNLEFI